MNTAQLDPKDWIVVDDQFAEQLHMKREFFAHDRARVFQVTPEAYEPSKELLDTLVEHLVRELPDVYQREGDLLINRKTKEAVNVVELEEHPLAIAGQLVQEDLNLVMTDSRDPNNPRLYVAGSCVCFPTGWSPRKNLGLSIAEVHKKVPRYPEKLERGVDGFLLKLSPERPMMRRNWFIYDDPTLAQPGERGKQRPSVLITKANAGKRLFLRSERETLVRLPKTGAIVFSIREHVYPLEAVKRFPEVSERLIDAIANLPEHAGEPYEREVVGYLSSR